MASYNLELIPRRLYKKEIPSNFKYYSNWHLSALVIVKLWDSWTTKERFEAARKQRKREHEIEHGFIYIRWSTFDSLTNRALSAGTGNVSSPLFQGSPAEETLWEFLVTSTVARVSWKRNRDTNRRREERKTGRRLDKRRWRKREGSRGILDVQPTWKPTGSYGNLSRGISSTPLSCLKWHTKHGQ